MAKEIELKLRLAASQVERLVSWLDSHYCQGPARQLNNSYYDTASLSLLHAKAALRIRSFEQAGRWRFEQTLKTRGQAQGSLQQRGEWNWPRPEAVLDLSVFCLPEVQAALPADLVLSDLTEVFTTDFYRRTWQAQWQGSQVELALDQGEIITQQQRQPICELELELLTGDADALWHLALAAAEQVPLWLSDISKAERGYVQAGLSAPWQPQAPTQPSLGWQLNQGLVHWQRQLEAHFDEAQQLPENLASQLLQLAYTLYLAERQAR